MATLKRILVTGATGKQGGAVISALLAAEKAAPVHVFALTRNAKSARAQALAKKPNVTVLEGNLDDCVAIFKKAAQPIHGVFSVQVPLKPKIEEQQGKALVDAAAAFGIQHFVYTSVERGGLERSDIDGTPVPHFISKFNIENHLKAVARERGGTMDWTIIRPVAFMDNLTPDFIGRAFATLWQMNGMNKKLQLVSSVDIGVLAAEAFHNQKEYASKAISFATDELTPTEANEIFKRYVGTDMPTTYAFVGRILSYLLWDQLGCMFKWFNDVGFGANPKEYTSKFPQMKGFERWLRESSGFKKQS